MGTTKLDDDSASGTHVVKAEVQVPSSVPSISRRRVRDAVSWELWCVALIGLWEQAAFWAMTVPWRTYSRIANVERNVTHHSG